MHVQARTWPSFLKRAQELTDLLYAKDGAKLGSTVCDPHSRRRRRTPRSSSRAAGRKITYFNTKERWEDLSLAGARRRSSTTTSRRPTRRSSATRTASGRCFTCSTTASWPASDRRRRVPRRHLDAAAGGASDPRRLKPAGLLHAFRGIDMPRGIVAGVRVQMSGPPTSVVYGKVASQPDFLRLGAGAFSQAGLDRWLQEGVEALRAERAQWPATPAAFLLAPPGSTAFLGMVAASVDAAGRSFPLALFREIATAEARETLPSLPTVLAGFVSDATTLLSSGPNFDGDTIARQAEALAVELPALPAPYAWKNEPASALEAALDGLPAGGRLCAAHAGHRLRPSGRRRDHLRERPHGRRTGDWTGD